jgi:hypothetical protein
MLPQPLVTSYDIGPWLAVRANAHVEGLRVDALQQEQRSSAAATAAHSLGLWAPCTQAYRFAYLLLA